MSQIASRDFPMNKNIAKPSNPPSVADPVGHSKALVGLYAPAGELLKQVESSLQSELKSDTPFVDQLLEHSWLLGGKRMRPVLLLLSAMAADNKKNLQQREQPLVAMATAVEMIHTATLVHDDVLDKADLRRHQPTANAKWGNRVSVLLGDYLFTHAFHVASKSGSAVALGKLAASSNLVCAGEMKQNFHAGNFSIAEEIYFEIISQKTAELCASSCGIGALLVDAEQVTVEKFEGYGRDLGIAFQIIDDVLDLVGSQNTVGKTLGTDLFNSKATLPVIHCLKHLSETDRANFMEVLDSGQDVAAAMNWINQTNSIQYARNVAQQHAASAKAFAEALRPSEASSALSNIAEFILQRTH